MGAAGSVAETRSLSEWSCEELCMFLGARSSAPSRWRLRAALRLARACAVPCARCQEKMVSVEVQGPTGAMKVMVRKQSLMEDLNGGGTGLSGEKIQQALLDGMCDNAFNSCDLDLSGELSFEEFKTWSGSDQLMSQIMRMFYY